MGISTFPWRRYTVSQVWGGVAVLCAESVWGTVDDTGSVTGIMIPDLVGPKHPLSKGRPEDTRRNHQAGVWSGLPCFGWLWVFQGTLALLWAVGGPSGGVLQVVSIVWAI